MQIRSPLFSGSLNGNAIAATLGKKKNELVDFIRKNEFFDPSTLTAFDRSRKDDGRYAINPSDSLIINNIKSIINILNSLEILLPHGMKPILELMQDNIAVEGSGYLRDTLKLTGHAASLAWNLGPNYSTLLGLKEEANELAFYMTELQSTLSSLPLVDSSFSPMIDSFNKSVGEDLQPLLEQIKLFLPFQTQTSAASDEEKIPEKKNQGMFAFVYENLKPIEMNIENHLTNQVENEQTAHLKHAQEAIHNFITALEKIDQTLSFTNVYLPSTILMDLGSAISALEEIDIESIKNLGADTFFNVLNQFDEKVGNLLIEVIKNTEYAEIHLGLKNEVLQRNLDEICDLYGSYSKNKNIKLTLLKAKLHIRHDELEKLKQKKLFMENMANQLESIKHIDDSTTLKKLIDIYQITAQLPKQGQACAAIIKTAIYKKIGLDKLENDIKIVELKALSANNEEAKKTLLSDLRSMYNLHRVITQDLINNDGDFSYIDNIHLLNNKFISIGKVKLEGREEICDFINESITSTNLDIGILNTLINDVEIKLIAHMNQDILYSPAAQFYKKIEDLSPLDLYQLESGILREYIDSIDRVEGIDCAQFKELLDNAINIQVSVDNIKFLNAAKDWFKDHKSSFNEYSDLDRDKLAALLNMEEIVDDNSYYTWFASTVFDYPIINKIDTRISELHNTQNVASKNLEQALSEWDSIRGKTLSQIRNLILNKQELENINAIVKNNSRFIYEIAGNFPVNIEQDANKILTDDFIVKRQLIKSVLEGMQSAKQKIKSLLDNEMVDAVEKKKFDSSYSEINNKYNISGTEPLLFRSMKSILNMLAGFEKLAKKFEDLNGIRAMLQFKNQANHELEELKLEIDDFLYQLNEIKATGLAMYSAILSEPLEAVGQMITPKLAYLTSFFEKPGIQKLIGDTSAISSKIKQAASIIQNVEDKNRVQLVKIDEIENGDEFEKKVDENIEFFNELVVNLGNTKASIVKISETGNRLYVLPIIHNLLALYKKSDKLYEYHEKLKTVLDNETFKNCLMELYIQSELTEARLGLAKETLSAPISTICNYYEGFVIDKTDASHAGMHFPYPDKKIELFDIEYEANNKTYNDIQLTIGSLTNLASIKSITDLIHIKKSLALLPPKKNTAFLEQVDLCIVKASGFTELNKKIEAAENAIAKIELNLIKNKSQLDTFGIRMDINYEDIQILQALKNKIDVSDKPDDEKHVSLSIDEIRQLLSYYPGYKRPWINEICNDLIHNPGEIIDFINETCNTLNDENKILQSKLKPIEEKDKLDQKQYSDEIEKCDGYRHLVLDPEAAVANQPSKIDTSDLTHNAKIISDLNELSELYLQKNTNLANYTDEIKEKLRAKKEEINILNDAKQEIAKIELTMGLKKDALLKFVFGNTNKYEFTSAARTEYKKSRISGLITQALWTNDIIEIREKYGFALNSTNDSLDELSKRSSGSSTFFYPIGRFFRRIFGITSTDDFINYTAEYFTQLSPEAREYKAPAEKMNTALFPGLTILGLHQNENIDLKLSEKDTDKSVSWLKNAAIGAGIGLAVGLGALLVLGIIFGSIAAVVASHGAAAPIVVPVLYGMISTIASIGTAVGGSLGMIGGLALLSAAYVAVFSAISSLFSMVLSLFRPKPEPRVQVQADIEQDSLSIDNSPQILPPRNISGQPEKTISRKTEFIAKNPLNQNFFQPEPVASERLSNAYKDPESHLKEYVENNIITMKEIISLDKDRPELISLMTQKAVYKAIENKEITFTQLEQLSNKQCEAALGKSIDEIKVELGIIRLEI